MNTYDSDSSEARAVAAAIAEAIASGIPPEQIAVLYRINVQSQAIETALGDAGVPCVVRGATRFFDQREVKEALMLLRGANVTSSIVPLFNTLRSKSGLSFASLSRLESARRRLRARATSR